VRLSGFTVTRTGIVFIGLTILLGPLYSEPEYSFVKNTVSELGAQNTRNNWVMILGFAVFGLSLAWDLFLLRQRIWLPFAFFGLFVAAAGFLPHQAWISGRETMAWLHHGHNLFANLSGIAVTMGFVVFGIRERNSYNRFVAYALASVCLLFPLAMFNFVEVKGLIQKMMYGLVFAWLWFNVPSHSASEQPLGRGR
jgi:hypothetical membrane protein